MYVLENSWLFCLWIYSLEFEKGCKKKIKKNFKVEII